MKTETGANIGETAQLFIDATRRKKALKEELERCERELKELSECMLNRFANNGINSLKTADGSTVYMQRQVWAGALDGNTAGLCDALIEEALPPPEPR